VLGRLNDARRLGERAVASSPRQRGFAAHALHLLGDCATHPDRFDGEPGEASPGAGSRGGARDAPTLVAHCHLGLGKVCLRTGKPVQARDHLATATTMYRDMGMTYWLEQAEAEMRQLR
jgi:hypothetical protein